MWGRAVLVVRPFLPALGARVLLSPRCAGGLDRCQTVGRVSRAFAAPELLPVGIDYKGRRDAKQFDKIAIAETDVFLAPLDLTDVSLETQKLLKRLRLQHAVLERTILVLERLAASGIRTSSPSGDRLMSRGVPSPKK